VSFEPLTPERRREMTRRYLLDAAAIVFARDGFRGATLDDVATTAGFTKGAVYSNFKSKDDLFLELLHDRIERQFAVVSEVVQGGSPLAAEQLPRIRDLLRGGSFWDDTWETLYLEFVLYAKRNPEARAKLAESARREREFVQHLIEDEHAAHGISPVYPTQELAEISMALFAGLSSHRVIDPESVSDQTLETALSMLYEAMGVAAGLPPAKPARTKRAGNRSRTRTRG
jgi:AcrR family transcriptional regulator